MRFTEMKRRFGNDYQRVELRISLGDEINARVVSVEAGAEDVATLDEFAMPAVLAESFFHGEDLSGMGTHVIVSGLWQREIRAR